MQFQEQVASIKRANSTQLYPHKRDTSSVLRQRHTQASVPCISSARQRQESADHLLTTAHLMPNSSTRTPESSYANNNNDYFTYISASQQNHRLASPNPNENNDDRLIPEIRLAPPNLEEQQQQHVDNVSIHVPNKNQDELKISVSMSMVLDDVYCTLFPTLQDWSSKTAFAKLSALVAVPLVLIFTLTLPVAEGDEVKVDDIEVLAPATTNEPQTNQQIVVITSSSGGDGETPTRAAAATTPAASKSYLTVPTSERSISELNTDEDMPLLIEEDEGQLGWCRWLVAVQAICATTFVTSVMACKSSGHL